MPLRDAHADAVGKTLAKRPSRNLDAVGQNIFRVSRRLRVQLAKTFELIERQIVSCQVQQRVKQHRTVSRRQQKTVAAKPFRIFRVVSQKLGPQHIRRRSHAQRQPRMPGIRLLHAVERERAYSVYAKLVEIGFRFGCGCHYFVSRINL